MAEKATFTSEMRRRTSQIHSASDALVNLKLGVAMSNDQVWAEGLLVFYEVFRRLEIALNDHKDSLIGEFRIPMLMRTQAFEKDLNLFLGTEWQKNYRIRPEVGQYLAHLDQVDQENPYLLLAYIYHLYMGLLSGGQILAGKRMLLEKVPGQTGPAQESQVTAFGDRSISSLKRQIKDSMNRVASELDPDTREQILEEGVKCFELNNLIIRSVKGVDEIFYQKVAKIVIVIVVFITLIKLLLL